MAAKGSGGVFRRKLVKVTVQGNWVLRRLECGHIHRIEALFGEQECLAILARQQIGKRQICLECQQLAEEA